MVKKQKPTAKLVVVVLAVQAPTRDDMCMLERS